MFNSIKKRLKAAWKRNKHRGNETISNDSEVYEELRIVYPNYAQLKDSDDTLENEMYMKLAYAVGKGFFDHLLSQPDCIQFAKSIAERIIDKKTPEGERFHVMYSAHDQDDRTWTLEENKRSPHRIREYEDYVKQSLLPYISDLRAEAPDRVYEVFRDNEHPNMEPFYRTQHHQGNCFAHAPIVLHFYLQLFYDVKLTAPFAYLVNLSRFIRNMYSGIRLFNYIVFNSGDAFQSVLDKLMPHARRLMSEYGDLSFEDYVTKLKQYGPAVVSMYIGPDFSGNRWHYEGTRPACKKKDLQGHGMLLVGIVKSGEDTDFVEGKDVHFILQNFWEDKQFVMVRRDYFRQCTLEEGRTRASFRWVISQPPCFAEPESIYAGRAGETRVSLSSDLLERPIDHQLFG